MDVNTIKQIREETGAGVMDIKKAIEEAKGDSIKAKEILKQKGIEKAEKKVDREIKSGRVFSYVHNNGSVCGCVLLGCETDFVAKNSEFEELGGELAKQIAAMAPESIEELLEQSYIRNNSLKIKDLVKEKIAKLGENISIGEIHRISV